VRVERVDPRDAEWETRPTIDYRVIFWTESTESSEYDLLGAEDVHAAIAWAEGEGRSRGCSYALYAKVHSREGFGLIWLAGLDPTAVGRPNFVRRYPFE
jgi:hypothetical protein